MANKFDMGLDTLNFKSRCDFCVTWSYKKPLSGSHA